MKKIFFVLCFCAWVFSAAPENEAVAPEVRRAFAAAGLPVLTKVSAAADFETRLLNGEKLRLQDLSGKVVFLNFWAGWCGPCQEEMPSMEALYQRFKAQGLEMLAVNYAEKTGAVKSFMKENNKLSFPVGLDQSGRTARLYGVSALPATYIIDRQGRIISRVLGNIDWSTPEVAAAFAALLKSQK